jgi:hypothetical protein
MRRFTWFSALAFVLIPFIASISVAGGKDLGYKSPGDVKAVLDEIAKNSNATVYNLGQTPGGRDILMLELGEGDDKLPAIMVVANMEGNYPIATEAALDLSSLLAGDWAEELASHRFYIFPVGNPDGYANFFKSPLAKSTVNDKPFNDDKDDATDEDGPDDLNSDGLITGMRQVHPEGKWIDIEDNPVLMKRAEKEKGETGKYRLFTEGIDNDGDGKINEDGPGGTNPGWNFPHNFKHHTKTDGLWSASEAESRALLRFAFDHTDIAMVLAFGRSNSLKSVPESSKKAEASQSTYKLPEGMAKRMGIDPDKEFTMDELMEMAREFTGYQDITEEMVLQFLGVGAAVNPNRNDIPYWSEISEKYNDFMKEAELDAERLKPAGFSTGSIEEWAYFQYGVPTFSMDFWTVPVIEKKDEEEKDEDALTPEKIEKMSSEEFIALGKEKIAAFLKESGAPAQFGADQVIQALQGGMFTTKRIAEFMRKEKKKEEAGGADETEQALFDYNPGAYVQWQPYDHPTLGKVEIGGMKPYATVAPPMDSVSERIGKQLPFLRKLVNMTPQIGIKKVEVEKKKNDIWKIDAWVVNNGFLPFPTHQGKRCQRPSPAVATLSGESITILEGRARKVLGLLEGSGGVQKVSWMVQGSEGKQVTIKAHTFSAGEVEQTVTLKGGGQ